MSTYTWITKGPYKRNTFILHFPANEEQIEKAKEIVKKIKFTYYPEKFDNPALQKHYVNIEAMALDRDQPEEITDYTCKCYVNIT